MSNMSYCRWRNTLNDLEDCAQDLEDRINGDPEEPKAPLSPDELRACEHMMELMVAMLSAVGVDTEDTPDLSLLSAATRAKYG